MLIFVPLEGTVVEPLDAVREDLFVHQEINSTTTTNIANHPSTGILLMKVFIVQSILNIVPCETAQE